MEREGKEGKFSIVNIFSDKNIITLLNILFLNMMMNMKTEYDDKNVLICVSVYSIESTLNNSISKNRTDFNLCTRDQYNEHNS